MSGDRHATHAAHADRATRVALLTSPAFLLAVATLAINDWLLKPAFGGWVTGKLSDVAGLFAFALFGCALLPRRRAAVLVTAALAWMAWKSPLADAPLATWNALGLLPLARVVDYGDWIALAMLPVAWRRAGRRPGMTGTHAWRRAGALASAVVAVLAFSATSIPQPGRMYYATPPAWTVAAARPEVREELAARGFATIAEYPRRAAEDSTLRTATVELRIGQTAGGDPVYVSLWLERRARDTTRITLLGARTRDGTGRPRAEAIRMLFEDSVIAPLRLRFGVVVPLTPGEPDAER